MKKNKLKSGLKSLLTAASNAVQGVDQSVPEEVKMTRMAICEGCENFIQTTKQCSPLNGGCGCFLTLKTSLRQEECPKQKWLKWEPKE